MKVIRIKDVRITVDDDTYNDLRGEKLNATKSGAVQYVGAYKKHSLGKLIMHVLFDDDLVVIHKNGDKTNFCRDNLEVITKGELMRRAGIFIPPKEEEEEDEENKEE